MGNKYFFIAILLCLASFLWMFCSTDGKQKTEKVNLKEQAELHRPLYHFTPQTGWMNDPNGMFYFEGEYHLFYQHYPDSTIWGPMHWGHAVSKDLINWQHLPIAIFPDSLGYIFSGSAVVDWKNTSGFGDGKTPPIVAMYTYHDMKGEKSGSSSYQSQGIAYSNDKGRTWSKFTANPVLPNPGNVRDLRDPKVIWHEASAQWVVTLAVKDHVEFWGSKEFKKWAHLGDFGKTEGNHSGVWECPDLFPISVEGTKEEKWVMLLSINPGGPNGGSATQYFVGNFDGKTFQVDSKFSDLVKNEKAVWLDYGRDNYATVTWSDVPKADGRRLSLGWMSNWDYAQKVPTTSWRSAMTIPRELVLKNTPDGFRLFGAPVREMKSLRSTVYNIENKDINQSLDITPDLGFSPMLSEMEFEVSTEGSADFGVELSNSKGEVYRVGLDGKTGKFYSDRTKSGKVDFDPKYSKITYAPRNSKDQTVKMHLFFDAASMELFADDGAIQLTDIFFPTEEFNQVKLFSNGKVSVKKGTIYKLKPVSTLTAKF